MSRIPVGTSTGFLKEVHGTAVCSSDKIITGILKVSKSQKHFFPKTPLPKKRMKNLTKFCPHSFKKNCFWDLLTFSIQPPGFEKLTALSDEWNFRKVRISMRFWNLFCPVVPHISVESHQTSHAIPASLIKMHFHLIKNHQASSFDHWNMPKDSTQN